MVEGVQCCVEVVEKYEAHQRISKIGGPLWESIAKFGRIYKPRHIVKHGSAEQSLHQFQHEWTAVGACDANIALEEQQQVAERAYHEGVSSWRECGLCPV